MPKWLSGLVIGALALFLANLALSNMPGQVETLTAAVDLTSTVVGFITLAVGLGAISITAAQEGISAVSTTQAAAPGILAVTGALLLVG